MFINSHVNYSRFSYGAKCGLGPKFDQEETIWNDKVVSGQVEGQAVATEHIAPFFHFSSNDILDFFKIWSCYTYVTNSRLLNDGAIGSIKVLIQAHILP